MRRVWMIIVLVATVASDARSQRAAKAFVVVSGKEPLDYIVIKLRRPDLPVQWTDDR